MRRTRGGRGTAVLLAVLLAGAGCDDARTVTSSPAEASPALIGLLLDNTLLRVRLSDGEVTAKASLGPADYGRGRFPGRYFAPGDGGRLFVLTHLSDSATDEVTVVDATTLALRDRYPLEQRIEYRGIVLAPSGLLYAYGNRRRELLDEATDAWAEDAVVTTVDTASGSVLATTTVRRAAGGDWWVYWGAVSTDGSALVLTYHGDDTTRADRLAISAEGLRRCKARGRSRYVGCIAEVHGSVVAHADGFLAATGTSKVLELDPAGAVSGSLHPAVGGHLMQIAASESDLYAVASCLEGGGLGALDLATETVRSWTQFCGERVAAGPDGRLAVAANVGGGARNAPSELVVVDESTGHELRSVHTHVDVLDLAFVP